MSASDLGKAALEARPGLGLGVLVLPPGEIAHGLAIVVPSRPHATLELLAGRPLLSGIGGHGVTPSRGVRRSYPGDASATPHAVRPDAGGSLLVGMSPLLEQPLAT